jgi:hypothetical protein
LSYSHQGKHGGSGGGSADMSGHYGSSAEAHDGFDHKDCNGLPQTQGRDGESLSRKSRHSIGEQDNLRDAQVKIAPVRCVVGASVAAVSVKPKNKYGDDVLAKLPSAPMRLDLLEKEGKERGYDMKMWKRVMHSVRNCPACNCRPVVVTAVVHLDK